MSAAHAPASARRLQLLAPAKLNLGLRVVGRRPDGYHEIASVFAPLDLADEVSVEVSDAEALTVHVAVEGMAEGIPADGDNLAARAASAFAEAAGLRIRAAIALTKHIPTGAGLGGGSSDAAAVLRALAELFPGALDPAVRGEIALGLGADVPFFLDPRPAWVTGIGERIEPLAGWPSLVVALANPRETLATASVYRAFDALEPALTRPAGALTLRPPWAGTVSALDLRNDLEPAAVRLCPLVARLRQKLRAAGASAVGMSGSGPTVFGVFATRDAAEAALKRADLLTSHPAVWVRVAATLESR